MCSWNSASTTIERFITCSRTSLYISPSPGSRMKSHKKTKNKGYNQEIFRLLIKFILTITIISNTPCLVLKRCIRFPLMVANAQESSSWFTMLKKFLMISWSGSKIHCNQRHSWDSFHWDFRFMIILHQSSCLIVFSEIERKDKQANNKDRTGMTAITCTLPHYTSIEHKAHPLLQRTTH